MNTPLRNFRIYSASAGSGKTYTLVGNYLEKILENGGGFNQVLAITFTNKATAEMKARIIRELDLLAKGGICDHLANLVDILQLPEAEIRTRAALQLQKILHDYSSFAVSTIDSYFQVLTRTLTRELRIPVKFDIELNEDKIRHEIAARLLSKAGYDEELTRWLRDLLFDKLEEGKGWKIQPELRTMTSQVMHKEEARKLARSANRGQINTLLLELNRIRKNFTGALHEIAGEAIAAIHSSGYTLADFAYGSTGAVAYFYKLQQGDLSKCEPGQRVQNALEDGLSLVKKNTKDTALLQLVQEQLHPLLCQAVEIYESGIHEYSTAEAVRRFLYYSGIIPVIGDELRKFRDEQQVFLLSDTTRLLRDNIGEQDAPFLFEKSGIRYRHVFIDEFQDTSSDQWKILLPLARNTLANGDRLLLVGDAKQSIYRWRGGNIQLIRKQAALDLRDFNSVLENKVLDTNYRSAEEIVQFNNGFFPKLAAAFRMAYAEFTSEELTEGWSGTQVEQKFTNKNRGDGYAEFTYFKSAGKEPAESSDNEDDHHWKEKALNKLKSVIDELTAEGYRYQDIAILFRNNSEEVTIANYLLNETTHPFISSSSLKLHSNTGVRFLLNCLYLMSGKYQPVHASEAREFLVLQKIDLVSTSQLPHDRIEKLGDVTWFREVLLPLKTQSTGLPVNLVIALLREKGKLTEADPFLDMFEDLVSEYAASAPGGISEFLGWWEEQLETKEFCLEMPEGTNAIRMLSIHRSKGLEFPAVIVPFLDWKFLPDHRTRLWASTDQPPYNEIEYLQVAAGKSLLKSVFADDYVRECREAISDNMNLVYVAFTRPKHRLYAFSLLQKRTDTISTLIHTALHSEEGLTISDTETAEVICRGSKQHLTREHKEHEPASLYSPVTIQAARLDINAALVAPQLAVSEISTEINFGKALHEVVAGSETPEHLEDQVHRAAVKYDLNSAELMNASKQVLQLLEQSGWLADTWTVYSEMDFCDAEGNIHRPDRILSNGQETVVLDFKTGVPAAEYKIQVQDYCKLLTDTGLPNVRGFLIYPAAGQILEVV